MTTSSSDAFDTTENLISTNKINITLNDVPDVLILAYIAQYLSLEELYQLCLINWWFQVSRRNIYERSCSDSFNACCFFSNQRRSRHVLRNTKTVRLALSALL